jgi:hypothetical protein
MGGVEMGVPVRDFLVNRRNRALGSILGHAEREIFPKLKDPALEDAFRTLVRDAISSYHDSVLDLVKAEDGIRNDVVVEQLGRLERAIRDTRALPASITGASGSNGRPI